MNIHDSARDFARQIRETDEYRTFTAAKDTAYADDTNRRLLDEYKRLQQKLQANLALAHTMDEADLTRLKQIMAVLQVNPDTSQYLIAEFRFQTMMADIYKILAETAGMDFDFMGKQ